VIVKTPPDRPTDKNIVLNYQHAPDGRQLEGGRRLPRRHGQRARAAALRVRLDRQAQNLDALLVALDAKIAKLAAGQES
jgi:hypothetical protein